MEAKLDADTAFSMSVECRVYEMERPTDVGERSSVVPGSFAGWVSLSSEDISLSDDEVFELLDSAHAEQSFIRRFLQIHNNQSGCLRTVGVAEQVEFDNVWVDCGVDVSYLESVIGEMDGGDAVLDSIDKYDTPVEVYGANSY